MKMKKYLALACVGVMAVGMLAGCGTTEEGAGGGAEGSAGAEAAAFEGFDETINISMYGMGFFGESGKDEVVDEINKISEDAINVHVDYTIMDIPTYMQQIGLMLSGGEKFDLVMNTAIEVASFNTFVAQNELADITDLIPVYAPETAELLGDYIKACEVGGRIYAIPSYRIYNSNYYLVMRKDVLDELGLTEQAQNISSWSEAEEVLLAVKDGQDSLPAEMQTTAIISNYDTTGNIFTGAMANTGADAFADNKGMDVLSNQSKAIYVDDNGKVQSWFETEDYRAAIERAHKWYEEGLVYKDAATAQDSGDTMMQNGITFSYCVQSEIGVEQAKKMATGYDVICIPYVTCPVQTQNGNTWAWGVPVTSENPEAAVAFMNLMWTNPDIENLFVYGIEGRDYEVNEAGEAVLLDTKEYQNSDWFFGNQFNAYPAEGTGGDFRETSLADMQSAEMSPYYGCVINTNSISNEITAVSNALTQYEPGIESGTSDPSQIDTMVQAMKDAGLQTIIDEYQAQLDAWLAEQ